MLSHGPMNPWPSGPTWPLARNLDNLGRLWVLNELPGPKIYILKGWVLEQLSYFWRHTGCIGLGHVPTPACRGVGFA